jgi:hypothetical protein
VGDGPGNTAALAEILTKYPGFEGLSTDQITSDIIETTLPYLGSVEDGAFIDEDTWQATAGIEIPKASPRWVAARSLDALQAERASVFPDRLAELVEDAVLTNMAAVLEDPQAVMSQLIVALRRDAGTER